MLGEKGFYFDAIKGLHHELLTSKYSFQWEGVTSNISKKNIIEAMKLAMAALKGVYLKWGLYRIGDNVYISYEARLTMAALEYAEHLH